ncbi:polysaccharide deacetylase family protein [Jiella marina]|uniref:polysaccharide deacetylase family protein n=1 Tax=Jiella sp. LLJ827 TaxID=2917712 RepID=UPI002100B4BD|nr:polysaccharide deacetylase family protein [Jiella sp. LLJ827]MCQ0986324.1 polysaccharide deacetylase family protein [Jiella sp. LLJ827]
MTGPRYDYSPITAPAARPWPGGKRLALYVALGIEEYAFGEGMSEDLFPGAPKPDYVNTSWRDYGNRVGAFRLIERLGAFGIRPTVLLNTDVYDTAPDLMRFARDHGAEIVGHGLANSDTLAGMERTQERAYLQAVADRIAKEEGQPPKGWSSPWLAETEATVDLLAECGYRYLLDLRMDDRPVWLETSSSPLLSIPYALELNDSTTMVERRASAAEFSQMIVDEFDELFAASSEQPLVMSIVVHSFISGVPFRLRALSRALEHIQAHSQDVWFATAGGIFDHLRCESAEALG